LSLDLLHVELADDAAPLAFDQRSAESLKPGLALLEEPQVRPDHVGRVPAAPGLHLGRHEGVEVVAEDEGRVLGLGGSPGAVPDLHTR
jgi:hypothetical protein